MKLMVKAIYPVAPESRDALSRRLEEIHVRIENRARELFTWRGRTCGHELDDWLTAERELYEVPKAQMKETANEIEIRAAVPGFEANQLEVSALPGIIAVDGRVGTEELDQKREERNGRGDEKVIFSEMGGKHLLRCFRLLHAIVPATVNAVLENGILTIVASKAALMSETERMAVEAMMHASKRPWRQVLPVEAKSFEVSVGTERGSICHDG